MPCFVVSPWTVGGFVASEQFDHTSTLQFLERLTGVQETNISAWRRQTFGDLTSALGFSNGKPTTFPPHLPQTIGEFWEAEKEVADAAARHDPRRRPDPAGAGDAAPRSALEPQSRRRREAAAGRALPGTTSRYIENRTTHAADFQHGGSDKVYLSKIAAVEHRDVMAGTAGADLCLRARDRRRQRRDRRHLGPTRCRGDHEWDDEPVWGGRHPGRQRGMGDGVRHEYRVRDPRRNEQDRRHDRRRIYPHGIAITPDGTNAYVANTGPNTGPGGSETVSVST